jgi:serine/threonine protein kinase
MFETNKNDIFEDYNILEEIGEGGQAKVYLAQKKDDLNEVAIKLIDKTSIDHKEHLYIQNEILIMSIIDHPNIIKMLDCYETDENYFIVLEYMRGGELLERIIEKESFSEEEAINVLKVLLDSVNYCHMKGIIHRDLKPENILYETEEDDSLLKIADFGVSKILNNPKELISTVIGSTNYIAPEVLQGFKYTAKCDIYALGNILYILLSGYSPFEENDQNKNFSEINFPDEDWADVSLEAKDLIQKMMQKNPNQRISMEEIFEHPLLKKKKYSNKKLSNLKNNLSQYMKRRKFRASQLAVYYLTLLKKK